MTVLPDAHRHLPTSTTPLIPHQPAIINSTSPADWPQLTALIQGGARSPSAPFEANPLPPTGTPTTSTGAVAPSDYSLLASHYSLLDGGPAAAYGIHPWHLDTFTPATLSVLRHLLQQNPNASIGEIGLDLAHTPTPPLSLQLESLSAQLTLAAELNRPATLHCVRAWDQLHSLLKTQKLPTRGILLHSPNPPLHLLPKLLDLGAYFSFSIGSSTLTEKQKQLRQQIPLSRLLLETDTSPFTPAGVSTTLVQLASLHGTSTEFLSTQIIQNFHQLFLPPKYKPTTLPHQHDARTHIGTFSQNPSRHPPLRPR